MKKLDNKNKPKYFRVAFRYSCVPCIADVERIKGTTSLLMRKYH